MLDDKRSQTIGIASLNLLAAPKKNGFFVDFGATNGFDLNNSYLLEKKFPEAVPLEEIEKSFKEWKEAEKGAKK